jgi:hypothetical protein
VWGSEFTTKAATYQGASSEFVARACVLIHEVTRAEKLADRRRAHSVDHAGLKVEEDSAGHVLAALGLRIIF